MGVPNLPIAGNYKHSTDDHYRLDGIRPGWRAFVLWEKYPHLFPPSCHVQMKEDRAHGRYTDREARYVDRSK